MRNLFFIVLCFVFTTNVLAQHKNREIENIVFEGAGIRGIAYGGVIHQLEVTQQLKNINNIAGTSAGAITALLLCLGYTSSEIVDIIAATKFQKFNEGGGFFIGAAWRIHKHYGWYKSKKMDKWLQHLIEAKTNNPNSTFEQLKMQGFKNLYVTATCLNKQKTLVFSAQTYPTMKIKDAVRCSMSIPLYFEAIFIDSNGTVVKKSNKNNIDVVVDGGITSNFPIQIFDSIDKKTNTRIYNKKTLGIRIDDEKQIQKDKIDKQLVEMPITTIKNYMQAFYVYTLENLNRNTLTAEDWERTISVSSMGIGPQVKKLSQEQKQKLYTSGIDSFK